MNVSVALEKGYGSWGGNGWGGHDGEDKEERRTKTNHACKTMHNQDIRPKFEKSSGATDGNMEECGYRPWTGLKLHMPERGNL
jgi:hypothetical protein